MFARKREYVDIKTSGYCRTGLGVGSPECNCPVPQPEKRTTKGAPDISGELLKELTDSTPELSIVIPDSVNSREKLSAFLIASGYARGSAEYMELYSKYRGGLQSECSYL